MSLRKSVTRCGVYLLAVIMVWVPTCVQAEMLSTQEARQSFSQNAGDRERLTALVLRQEVQAQFQEYGVSGTEAMNRVNTMTDEEVASVINQIEEYASGGDPLWRASGDRDAGYIFMIVVVLAVLGCLAVCFFFLL